MATELDWQGNATAAESPDTTITIWVITPGSNGGDETWVRDYHRATEHAADLIQQAADEASLEGLLEHGITVKMRLRRVRLDEYEAVRDEEA